MRGQALDVDGRSIQYNILKREADTNRQLYDSLLQRYKEVGVAGDVRANNVSIIDRAQIAWRVKPNLFTNLALGVLLGGLLGAYIYIKRNKLALGPWLDIAAVALPLGQAIGRWANWINQESYGGVTTLPWGITIDSAHRVQPYGSTVTYPVATTFFHPLFLYESFWSLLFFIILLYLAAPALAVLVKYEVLSHVVGLPFDQLPQWTERELLAIHGVGPKAIRILREELAARGLSLREH